MENWIGAYRLPNQTASLGVDRGGGGGAGGEGSLEGGVSPIPGSTPSPNLLNMWNHAIKVETSSHGLPGSHPNNQGGSIKGQTFLSILLIRIVVSISIVGGASIKFIDANKPFLSERGGSGGGAASRDRELIPQELEQEPHSPAPGAARGHQGRDM